jgi:hypothetical protein
VRSKRVCSLLDSTLARMQRSFAIHERCRHESFMAVIGTAEAYRRALNSMLLMPLAAVVGSTEEGRWPRRHGFSQSQRPAKRSETPTAAEPWAALCLLQVYRKQTLFWASIPSRLSNDGKRRTGDRVDGDPSQVRTTSLALGL